jgi:hypothetical protein
VCWEDGLQGLEACGGVANWMLWWLSWIVCMVVFGAGTADTVKDCRGHYQDRDSGRVEWYPLVGVNRGSGQS